MKDIESLDDIKLFVDEFYNKVRQDELIEPIFSSAINEWQPHLDKMYSFWNAALFGVPGFKGNPFARHAPLPIVKEHFDRWLKLFAATIDTHFAGTMAESTKQKAELMAVMFVHKLGKMKGGADHVIV